jgi:hypothetical protein
MSGLRDVKIVGVHPVHPSDELFQETLEIQWGPDLEGDELEEAREHVRAHFDGLYLFEVQLDPPDVEVDWVGGFTQSSTNVPERERQVPYDERVVDQAAGRWAFFLHDVELEKPLRTPVGSRPLPEPTPMPASLKNVQYVAP